MLSARFNVKFRYHFDIFIVQGSVMVHAEIQGVKHGEATRECEIIFSEMIKKEVQDLSQMRSRKKQKKQIKFILKLQEARAKITGVSIGNSVDLIIKNIAAAHLRILWHERVKLSQQLAEDIKSLPECQQYDLSDLQIEFHIDRETFEESLANLIESKARFSFLCFKTYYLL